MPKVNKQQLIFMIDGLMDPTTRPGTVKMAGPVLGQMLAEVLSAGIDQSMISGQNQAKKQLGAIFSGQLTGNPANDAKNAAQEIVHETAKGFFLGIVNHLLDD